MARVKTFTNGGSLLPGDLNSIEDDYEGAFSQYKLLLERSGNLGSGTAQVYSLAPTSAAVNPLPVPHTATGYVFNFDGATDAPSPPRTVKCRVRAFVVTNAVAPAINFTFGLYPVATWGGVSGAVPTVATLGSVTAGSTVAFNAPPLSTASAPANSGDFTVPAAGSFVLGVVLSGAQAANSQIALFAQLQLRQV